MANVSFSKQKGTTPVADPALLGPGQISDVINRIFNYLGGPGPSYGEGLVRPGTLEYGGRVTPRASNLLQGPNIQARIAGEQPGAGATAPSETATGQLPLGIEQSPFFNLFRSALTDRFTPTTAEDQLLQDIMGQTSSQFSRRGLGTSPIAASTTAASIAPALVQLRQQQINSLANALGQTLQGQEWGLIQRAQDIAGRFNTIQSLLNFLQFGKRTPIGSTGGGGFSFGVGIGIPAGGGGGGSSTPAVGA